MKTSIFAQFTLFNDHCIPDDEIKFHNSGNRRQGQESSGYQPAELDKDQTPRRALTNSKRTREETSAVFLARLLTRSSDNQVSLFN